MSKPVKKPVKKPLKKPTKKVSDIPLHKAEPAKKASKPQMPAVTGPAAKRPLHKARKAVRRAKTFSGAELITGLIAGVGLAVFIGLALIVAIRGDLHLIGGARTVKPPSQAKGGAPSVASNTASGEPLSVKIVSWYANAGDQYFKPDYGNQFVVVNVSLVHHLKSAVWFAPVLQSYLIDTNGTTYGMSPLSLEHPFDAKLYKAGETAAGELSYQLPLSVADVQWCYRLDAASPEPVCQSLAPPQ